VDEMAAALPLSAPMGLASAGLCSVLIWPDEIVGAFSFGAASSSVAVALELVPVALSMFPRMTGKPSLPPPIITIFEFRD
jgi:hypothetical protein